MSTSSARLSGSVTVHRSSVAATVARTVGLSACAAAAQAQQVPAMLDPTLIDQYSRTERQMATAVVGVLSYVNGNNGAAVCPDGPSTCPDSVSNLLNYDLFSLNESAEEILERDGGENGYHVTLAGFKDALRWLAPEELFALAPMATGFASGQLGTLSNRLSAIRSLSRSQRFARNVVSPALKNGYASNAGIPAGSAGDGFSRLNLFFDAAVNFGNRGDTTGSFGGGDEGTENAFDFDGRELALGVDWRYSDSLVAGALLGYSDRKLSFDSGESAADGKVESSGVSLLGFVQWDDLRWYGNLALGYQKLSYDAYRRIVPNPEAVYSPDTTTKGSPDGAGLLASFSVGLPFQRGAWGTDVYFNATWQRQSVDAFSERVVDDSSETVDTGSLFDVGKQNIKSLDTMLGVKFQYVATPSFGVVVPFLRAELHRELQDSPHKLQLTFQGLDEVAFDSEAEYQAALDAFQFNLVSDRPDKSWVSAAVGVSAIIRGSNRVSSSGRAGGGLQAYLQYSTVFGLAHFDSGAINAGLRYEF